MHIYLPNQNKYYRWYISICNKSLCRGLDKSLFSYYTERHHIIPTALGGINDNHNLCLLTAKEHLICHWLLIYCYDGDAQKKMTFAFNRMCSVSNKCSKRSPNSRIYEIARKKLSDLQKQQIPWNKGKKTGPSPKKHLNKCTCELCGRTYIVANWKLKITKYCSKKCFDFGSKGKTRLGRPKRLVVGSTRH